MPTLVPLGDSALLVRFGDRLTDTANLSAIRLGRLLQDDPIAGVAEVVPNLVSVMLRFDSTADPMAVAGQVRLRMARPPCDADVPTRHWQIAATFDGVDLPEVADALGLAVDTFVAAHNSAPLRVLATGFAPGFVYCGMHDPALHLPRRAMVRPKVAAGSILFAAGQTSIAATNMPTGWHLIGHTDFTNFDPGATPPTRLAAGDKIQFVATP